MNLGQIGQRVRTQRKERQLSQHELARVAGLSRLTINQLERGTAVDLGVQKLERVLNVLGLELSVRDLSPRPTLDDLLAEQRLKSAAS